MANNAVEVGGPDAEADQREHVRAAMDDRAPGPAERPTAPEDDRRRQRPTAPSYGRLCPGMEQRLAEEHVAHGDEEDRQAQDQADPEAPAHVDQLGIG